MFNYQNIEPIYLISIVVAIMFLLLILVGIGAIIFLQISKLKDTNNELKEKNKEI